MPQHKIEPYYNWEKYLLQKMVKPTTFCESIKAEDQCMVSIAVAREACLMATQEGREEGLVKSDQV